MSVPIPGIKPPMFGPEMLTSALANVPLPGHKPSVPAGFLNGIDLGGLGPILAGLGQVTRDQAASPLSSLGNPNIKAGVGGIIPTNLPSVNPASIRMR